MKTLLLLAAVSLTSLSHASEPYRLDGEFTYRNLELLQTRDVEVVPQQRSERVEELRQEKYTCERALTFYRCVKFIKNDQIPEQIKTSVLRRWETARVRFTRGPGNVILTNDAPSLTEWDILDKVRMGSQEVKKYHYYLLAGEIHKIKVPFATEEEWFLVHDERRIAAFALPATETGKFRFREFVILINLAK